nr:fibrohexamerin [Yponomeuta cagnagella]
MLRSLLLACAASVCLAEPNIVRPCHLQDLECIQDNLAANSHCKTNIAGTAPTATVSNFRFECPFFHSSYIENNLIMRNVDSCVVSEFFFNMDTDKALLSIDCLDFGLEADRTVLQHRSLHEDSVYQYHINSTYPILRLTTNMNNADRINFCSEYTFVEIPVLPIFHIDPKDKLTSKFLTRDMSELFAFERETFNYRGSGIMNWFLQHKICDFGCNFD